MSSTKVLPATFLSPPFPADFARSSGKVDKHIRFFLMDVEAINGTSVTYRLSFSPNMLWTYFFCFLRECCFEFPYAHSNLYKSQRWNIRPCSLTCSAPLRLSGRWCVSPGKTTFGDAPFLSLFTDYKHAGIDNCLSLWPQLPGIPLIHILKGQLISVTHDERRL